MTTNKIRCVYAWSDASGTTTATPEAAPPATVAHPCELLTLAVPGAPGPATFEGDFDQLLAEMESTQAPAMADARRWVGAQFYADAPTLAGLRLAAGLSQRQLAEACGMEQPHVSRFESGRHEPTIGSAKRLATALGVDLDTLHAAWLQTNLQGKGASDGH